MMVYETIYLELCTNNPYICHKNYSAQLFFILGIAKLHLNVFITKVMPR